MDEEKPGVNDDVKLLLERAGSHQERKDLYDLRHQDLSILES